MAARPSTASTDVAVPGWVPRRARTVQPMDEPAAVRAIGTAIRQPGIVHAELRLRRDDVEHVYVAASLERGGATTVALHLMALLDGRVRDDLELDHWLSVVPDGRGAMSRIFPEVDFGTATVAATAARRALEQLFAARRPPDPAPLVARTVSIFDDPGWAQIGCFVALISAVVGVALAALIRLLLSQPIDGGRAVPLAIAGAVAAVLLPPVLVSIASRVPILRRWLAGIAYVWLFVGAPVVIVIVDQVWRVPPS